MPDTVLVPPLHPGNELERFAEMAKDDDYYACRTEQL